MLIDIKQRSQITLPKALLDKLNLNVGDTLEINEEDGKLILTPVVVIPKDQEWYFSKEWQAAENEVDQQIKQGQIHVATGIDDLFDDLGISE